MRNVLYMIIVCFGLLAGCGAETSGKVGHAGDSGNGQLTENKSSGMPDIMPSDFNFRVSYGYGEVTKNEINTYENTATKDLVVNGEAQTDLTLSEDEMRGIYEKMKEIDITGRLKLKPDQSSCSVVPYNEDSWKVTAGGKTVTLSWSEEHCELTDDAKALKALRMYIQRIVEGKEAYQQLPEAKGGYD